MHLYPPTIPLVKAKNDNKRDNNCIKIKLRRDPTSQKSDLFYEFKTDLFDNGYPEEFFYLIRNFNMTIEASGTLVDSTNIHYLYTLVRGEALRPFGILSAKAGSINSEHLKSIILGLGKAFPPVNALSKQKRTMRRGI